MVSFLGTHSRTAAPLTRQASSLLRLSALVLAGFLALPSLGLGADALVEPSDKELRRAYIDFLYDFVAIHGDFVDPGCSLEGAGCAVRLLDVRRDYRLVTFKKKACHPTEPAGFACSFETTVTCKYTTKTSPGPMVADLYCDPVFNKSSTYVAQLEITPEGWLITRFLEG